MMLMTRAGTLLLVSAKKGALDEDKLLQSCRHHRDFYEGVSGSLSSVLQDVPAVGRIVLVMQSLSETPEKSD